MTRWEQVGSIDRLFRHQFARIMNHAWSREIPASVASGIVLDEKFSDPELEHIAQSMDARYAVWPDDLSDNQVFRLRRPFTPANWIWFTGLVLSSSSWPLGVRGFAGGVNPGYPGYPG